MNDHESMNSKQSLIFLIYSNVVFCIIRLQYLFSKRFSCFFFPLFSVCLFLSFSPFPSPSNPTKSPIRPPYHIYPPISILLFHLSASFSLSLTNLFFLFTFSSCSFSDHVSSPHKTFVYQGFISQICLFLHL